MLQKNIIGILLLITLLVIFPSESIAKTNTKKTFIGPTKGAISSIFGWRGDPFTGVRRFHCGLDIAAKSGTPIYALQEGYVVFNGTKGGYGKVVTIRHQYSDIPELPIVETMYAHNSSNLVAVGQYVKRGDVIALVGSTGRSTGPHLHFEVHYSGGYVNPVDYLTKLPSYLKYVNYKRSKYYAYKQKAPQKIKPHIAAQDKTNYIMIED
ncbi:MAG: M23 family metallopeptidase [Vampirovibrionia bacterium]